MITTDPIADLLTRIRNGLKVRKSSVLAPASKMNLAIAKILEEQGYIQGVSEVSSSQGKKLDFPMLKIGLKYSNTKPVITQIQRVSRPGQRIYLPVNQLHSVLRGVGVAVVSTSKGLLTDAQARREGIGGEVLFKVW